MTVEYIYELISDKDSFVTCSEDHTVCKISFLT